MRHFASRAFWEAYEKLPAQVRDIIRAAGQQIVHAGHLVAARDEGVAKMRADEPGAAGDQNALRQP